MKITVRKITLLVIFVKILMLFYKIRQKRQIVKKFCTAFIMPKAARQSKSCSLRIYIILYVGGKFKETLIKSFVHIAPTDFSSGWTNKPQ